LPILAARSGGIADFLRCGRFHPLDELAPLQAINYFIPLNDSPAETLSSFRIRSREFRG
jgi:hypothetical protein